MSGRRTSPRSRQTKPAPCRRDREVEPLVGGELVALLQPADLEPPDQVGRAERVAPVWERDHDPLSGADERGELLLGLGEPAGGDRRPLRLERVRLPARETDRAAPRRRREPGRAAPPPTPARPPRARRRGPARGRTRGTRSSGTARLARLPRAAQVGLDEVEAPLGRRVDDGTLDRPERSLRERRERADRLDLVAEQLDPERVAAGGREDVDDPAADGELAALLDPLHPLVAGKGEVLRERCRSPARRRPPSSSRAGSRLRRRQPLGERGRRRADEPAACEHVERAGPLADQVRRRLEPGVPADAAAREQRDALVAEVPGGSLGSVAGVRVLGQQHEQRAVRGGDGARRGAAAGRARRHVRPPLEGRPRTRRGARSRPARGRAAAATGAVRRSGWSMTKGGTGGSARGQSSPDLAPRPACDRRHARADRSFTVTQRELLRLDARAPPARGLRDRVGAGALHRARRQRPADGRVPIRRGSCSGSPRSARR